jgi:hypothetical protein
MSDERAVPPPEAEPGYSEAGAIPDDEGKASDPAEVDNE